MNENINGCVKHKAEELIIRAFIIILCHLSHRANQLRHLLTVVNKPIELKLTEDTSTNFIWWRALLQLFLNEFQNLLLLLEGKFHLIPHVGFVEILGGGDGVHRELSHVEKIGPESLFLGQLAELFKTIEIRGFYLCKLQKTCDRSSEL